MGKIDDLKGKKFNRLTVLEFSEVKNNRAYWKCECECGNIVYVNGTKLKSSHTKSCGCLNKEKLSAYKKTHGDSNTRFYSIWSSMKKRCLNKNDSHYHEYGGRGITVCEEWKNSYIHFKNDMYADYCTHVNIYGEKNTTLERINVNGDYSKENCTWVTLTEQSLNKRTNVRLIDTEVLEQTFERISKENNIKINTVRSRYYYLKKHKIEQTEENIINYKQIRQSMKSK